MVTAVQDHGLEESRGGKRASKRRKTQLALHSNGARLRSNRKKYECGRRRPRKHSIVGIYWLSKVERATIVYGDPRVVFLENQPILAKSLERGRGEKKGIVREREKKKKLRNA